jgi:hypothetical protein
MPYKEKIIGIYKIQSRIKPERVYIGSASNMLHRWVEHKHQLRNGKHHSPKLQRHYDKYGEDDLIFELVENIGVKDRSLIMEREKFYINFFRQEDDNKPYFNICSEPHSSLGVKRSEEICLAISKRQKENPRPPRVMTEEEAKSRSLSQLGNTNGKGIKGKKRSKEACENMRNARINSLIKRGKYKGGKKKAERDANGKLIVSEETRLKMSIAGKNRKPISEETRKKMGEVRKGRKFSEEHKRKISEGNKGKKKTEEQRLKMSKSRKGKPSKMKGKKMSEIGRQHLKESKKGMFQGENNPFYGRHHTEESKRKIGNKNRKKPLS